MITFVTVWLLIAISDGSDNRGHTTFERLATKEDCMRVAVQINKTARYDSVRTICVETKVLK